MSLAVWIRRLVELALALLIVGDCRASWPACSGSAAARYSWPVLYECFRIAGVPLEVRMPLCVGTSLAIIIPTAIRSFRALHARGAVDPRGRAGLGAADHPRRDRGSLIASYAPERLFKIVFVIVAWSAAARLILARDSWKLGDKLPAAA